MPRKSTMIVNPKRIEVTSLNTVTIPCDKYEDLVKAKAEIRIVRQYLEETTSSFTNVDDIRLILGIKKED